MLARSLPRSRSLFLSRSLSAELPCLDAVQPPGSLPCTGLTGARLWFPSQHRAEPLDALLHLSRTLTSRDGQGGAKGCKGAGELLRGCSGWGPSPSAQSKYLARNSSSHLPLKPGRVFGLHRERTTRKRTCRSSRRAASLRPPPNSTVRGPKVPGPRVPGPPLRLHLRLRPPVLPLPLFLSVSQTMRPCAPSLHNSVLSAPI